LDPFCVAMSLLYNTLLNLSTFSFVAELPQFQLGALEAHQDAFVVSVLTAAMGLWITVSSLSYGLVIPSHRGLGWPGLLVVFDKGAVLVVDYPAHVSPIASQRRLRSRSS
jgi:hypothetical protein